MKCWAGEKDLPFIGSVFKWLQHSSLGKSRQGSRVCVWVSPISCRSQSIRGCHLLLFHVTLTLHCIRNGAAETWMDPPIWDAIVTTAVLQQQFQKSGSLRLIWSNTSQPYDSSYISYPYLPHKKFSLYYCLTMNYWCSFLKMLTPGFLYSKSSKNSWNLGNSYNYTYIA